MSLNNNEGELTIPEFYAGKNIFITGGTGFLGTVLIEALLSSTPKIGKIYLLIRDKYGSDTRERIKRLLSKQVSYTWCQWQNGDYIIWMLFCYRIDSNVRVIQKHNCGNTLRLLFFLLHQHDFALHLKWFYFSISINRYSVRTRWRHWARLCQWWVK